MKFSKLSQLFLVSSIGLILATLLTACQLVTIDYVFVACSAGNTAGSAGQIYAYAVDAESGALRTGAPHRIFRWNRPGGDGHHLRTFTTFMSPTRETSRWSISASMTHGMLTQKDSVTLAGAPVALAVNSANTYLYVFRAPLPPRSLSMPLEHGAIGSATATLSLTLAGFPSDTIVPTGVTVLANSNAVYVTAYDKSAYNPGGVTTSNANPGWVFGYAVGSSGALTAVSGSPYQAGVKPSALTTDPTSRFVFVTDYASNELIGYTVLSNNTLQLHDQRPIQNRQRAHVDLDGSARHLHLPDQLAGFDRFRATPSLCQPALPRR